MSTVQTTSRRCVALGLLAVGMLGAPSDAEAGCTTVYEYDNKMNQTLTYTYDSSSGVTLSGTATEHDELGRSTFVRRFSSTAFGDDTNDDISLTLYDANGSVSKDVRKAPGKTSTHAIETGDVVTQYDYDTAGRQTKVSSPEGGIAKSDYDAAGNVTRQRVVYSGTSELTTTMAYDGMNRVTKSTDPEGHYREMSYNSQGLQYKTVAKTSGGTAVSQDRTFHDDAGRSTKQVRFVSAADTGTGSDTIDNVVKYTYDVDGRVLIQTTYNMHSATALNTVNEYDGHGRVTLTTNPAGLASDSLYDATGSVTKRLVNDGIGTRTFTMSYDDDGRLVTQVALAASSADDLTTTFLYDCLGRTTKQTDPLSQVAEYEYDMLGQQTLRTEDSGTIARDTDSTYDRLGRLITLAAYDDDDAEYQYTQYNYDLAGRRTQIIYPDGSSGTDDVDFAFDLAGRMTKQTDQRGWVVDYQYEKRGLMTLKSHGSEEEAFAYDGLGRMITALKGTTSDVDAVSETVLAYDDLSRLTQESQELFGASATTLTYGYDQAGNRTRTTPGGSVILTLYYEVDALNQVTAIDRYNGTSTSQVISYDYSDGIMDKRTITTSYAYCTVEVEHDPVYDDLRRMTKLTNTVGTTGTWGGRAGRSGSLRLRRPGADDQLAGAI